MSFDRLIGQERLVEMLRRAIRSDHLAHALLVVGPPGSGKRTLAREIGKALLCETGAGDACDACRACRLVDHGNHPDFGLFAREASHSLVRVETARALQAALALRPFAGSRKVALLPEANLLTEAAANCLLKTLEEPPGGAVVILTAESTAEILPTILSRCQVLKMAPLTPARVAEELERQHGLPVEQAAYAGAMSGGSLGRALDLAGPDWYDLKRRVVEHFSVLTAETVFTVSDDVLSRARRLGSTASAAAQGPGQAGSRASLAQAGFRETLCRALDFAAALYRDAALGGAAPPVHADQPNCCPRHLGPAAAAAIADRVLEAREQVQANANPALVLDALLIEIATRQAAGGT